MKTIKPVIIFLILFNICFGFFVPNMIFAFNPVPFRDQLYNKAVWVEISELTDKKMTYLQDIEYTAINVKVKKAYNYESDPEGFEGFAYVKQVYVPNIYLNFVADYGEALMFLHRDDIEGVNYYFLRIESDDDQTGGWSVMSFFPIAEGKVLIPNDYVITKINYGGKEYLTSSSDEYASIMNINESFIKKGKGDRTFYDGMETGRIKIFFDELRRSEEASERWYRAWPYINGAIMIAGAAAIVIIFILIIRLIVKVRRKKNEKV